MNLFMQISQLGNSVTSLAFGHHTAIKLADVIVGDYTENEKKYSRGLTLKFEKYNEKNQLVGRYTYGMLHLNLKFSQGPNDLFTLFCDLVEALYFGTDVDPDEKIDELLEAHLPATFDLDNVKTQKDLEILETSLGNAIAAVVAETAENKPLLKIKVTANYKGFLTLSSEAQAVLNNEDPRELPEFSDNEKANSEKTHQEKPTNPIGAPAPASPMAGFPVMGASEGPDAGNIMAGMPMIGGAEGGINSLANL